MSGFGFLMCCAIIAGTFYTIGEVMANMRRNARRALADGRANSSDGDFTVGVSALTPVPESFVRAFRLGVGRALGIEGRRLLPSDRIRGDLRVTLIEAIELSTTLERMFDTRVRIHDILTSRTLRDLCKRMYAKSEEISEFDPPLHRDPLPKLREPEAVVPEPEVVPVSVQQIEHDE